MNPNALQAIFAPQISEPIKALFKIQNEERLVSLNNLIKGVNSKKLLVQMRPEEVLGFLSAINPGEISLSIETFNKLKSGRVVLRVLCNVAGTKLDLNFILNGVITSPIYGYTYFDCQATMNKLANKQLSAIFCDVLGVVALGEYNELTLLEISMDSVAIHNLYETIKLLNNPELNEFKAVLTAYRNTQLVSLTGTISTLSENQFIALNKVFLEPSDKNEKKGGHDIGISPASLFQSANFLKIKGFIHIFSNFSKKTPLKEKAIIVNPLLYVFKRKAKVDAQ